MLEKANTRLSPEQVDAQDGIIRPASCQKNSASPTTPTTMRTDPLDPRQMREPQQQGGERDDHTTEPR